MSSSYSLPSASQLQSLEHSVKNELLNLGMLLSPDAISPYPSAQQSLSARIQNTTKISSFLHLFTAPRHLKNTNAPETRPYENTTQLNVSDQSQSQKSITNDPSFSNSNSTQPGNHSTGLSNENSNIANNTNHLVVGDIGASDESPPFTTPHHLVERDEESSDSHPTNNPAHNTQNPNNNNSTPTHHNLQSDKRYTTLSEPKEHLAQPQPSTSDDLVHDFDNSPFSSFEDRPETPNPSKYVQQPFTHIHSPLYPTQNQHQTQNHKSLNSVSVVHGPASSDPTFLYQSGSSSPHYINHNKHIDSISASQSTNIPMKDYVLGPSNVLLPRGNVLSYPNDTLTAAHSLPLNSSSTPPYHQISTKGVDNKPKSSYAKESKGVSTFLHKVGELWGDFLEDITDVEHSQPQERYISFYYPLLFSNQIPNQNRNSNEKEESMFRTDGISYQTILENIHQEHPLGISKSLQTFSKNNLNSAPNPPFKLFNPLQTALYSYSLEKPISTPQLHSPDFHDSENDIGSYFESGTVSTASSPNIGTISLPELNAGLKSINGSNTKHGSITPVTGNANNNANGTGTSTDDSVENTPTFTQNTTPTPTPTNLDSVSTLASNSSVSSSPGISTPVEGFIYSSNLNPSQLQNKIHDQSLQTQSTSSTPQKSSPLYEMQSLIDSPNNPNPNYMNRTNHKKSDSDSPLLSPHTDTPNPNSKSPPTSSSDTAYPTKSIIDTTILDDHWKYPFFMTAKRLMGGTNNEPTGARRLFSRFVGGSDSDEEEDHEKELDDKFHQFHPDVGILLSRIRRIKEMMTHVAQKENVEKGPLILAFHSFDKLVRLGTVTKGNRKVVGAICVLLAVKYQGSKDIQIKPLIESLARAFDIHKNQILRAETFVFLDLGLSLSLDPFLYSKYEEYLDELIANADPEK